MIKLILWIVILYFAGRFFFRYIAPILLGWMIIGVAKNVEKNINQRQAASNSNQQENPIKNQKSHSGKPSIEEIAKDVDFEEIS